MGSSASKDTFENVDEKVLLECTLCHNRLQNPTSLTCLHSFCLACLENWVKKKDGELICPTCNKSYSSPEGRPQKLEPNTFLNNVLDIFNRYSKRDQIKCFCGKNKAENYCSECKVYLCSTCSGHHEIHPLSKNHKLQSVQEMTLLEFASLNPLLCSLHDQPFEFYCIDCKTQTCKKCTSSHTECEGKNKPIRISEAVKKFKGTSEALKKCAQNCKTNLQDRLNTVIQNAEILEESKTRSLRDIDNHVEKILRNIKRKGDELKNKVEKIYNKKNDTNDAQIDVLSVTLSDINTKLTFLSQCLKMDETRVMQCSDNLIAALNDSINEIPATESDDKQQVYFFENKQMLLLQKRDIGNAMLHVA